MTSEPANGHLVKRQKLDVPAKKRSTGNKTDRTTRSLIFAPFRTLGLVSPTAVPFDYNPTTHQITTSVGRSLTTYSLERGLNRLWITRPETPSPITAFASVGKVLIAAFGDPRQNQAQGLFVSRRGDTVAQLELPRDLDEPIRNIIVVPGAWIIAAGISRVDVWKDKTYEHHTTLRAFNASEGAEITGGICTLDTTNSKVLVGRKNGSVEMWNIIVGKVVYTFKSPSRKYGAVTCLQPCPALMTLAIAYANGQLNIRDMNSDIVLMDLVAGTPEQPVNSIAFRTDGRGGGEDGASDGVMATSTSATGDIAFWDLSDGHGRLAGTLRSAHNPPSLRGNDVRGGINKLEFLPSQNVLISSGLDNSLKTWVFDKTPFSPVPRVLHSRSGHSGPVNCIHWLQSDFDGFEAGKKWLLTGSEDRSLWGWSLRKDGQSTELSQGNIQSKAKKRGLMTASFSGATPASSLEDLKAPEIICMATSLNRDGGIGAIPGKIHVWHAANRRDDKGPEDAQLSLNTGWESIVTAHKDDSCAKTWFWGRKRAGRWALPTSDRGYVSTVAMTTCGTFALVGSITGGIDMFNLQSGRHRLKFPSPVSPGEARRLRTQRLMHADSVTKLKSGALTKFPAGIGKHTAAVTGIVASPVHAWIASCSLDGNVNFWDFSTGILTAHLQWGIPVTKCRFHAGTELIAFSCEDNVIRLVDVTTKNVVRQFRGCQDKINDFCWSHDGRWIVACSQDYTIRTWDLPTGNMVDGFRLEKPCRALAMAETDEYLATAIEGEIGIGLWVNKAFFLRQAPTKQISEESIMSVLGPQVTGTTMDVERELELNVSQREQLDEINGDDLEALDGVDQVNADLMRLSLVPTSRWQTLLHLDVIKARNKPIEPPKKPEKAPFFLPSTVSEKSIAAAEDESDKSLARIPLLKKQYGLRALTPLLQAGARSGNYDAYIERLKMLSPSEADIEISSLSRGDGTTPGANDLVNFLAALTARRRQKKDFEMIEVWMKVFMQVHDEEISQDEETAAQFKIWHEESKRSWKDLDNMVSYCTASFNFFLNPEA